MIDDVSFDEEEWDANVNGIPLIEFSRVLELYPTIKGGVYIIPKMEFYGYALAERGGQILLRSQIPTDAIRDDVWGEVSDPQMIAWLCFLHEVGHFVLGHVHELSAVEKVKLAKWKDDFIKNEGGETYHKFCACALEPLEKEASVWAIREYARLLELGEI